MSQREPAPWLQSFDEVLSEYQNERSTPGLGPIALGYGTLDTAMRGGVSVGQVCGLAARTSTGKTWWLVSVVDNIGELGTTGCIVLTLEQPAVEWAERALAVTEGVSPEEVEGWARSKRLAQHSFSFLERMANTLVCERKVRSTDIPKVIEEARKRLGDRVPVRAIVIDYGGLIETAGRDPYERASRLAVELKEIAKAERVAIIVAFQVSRAGGDGSEPVTIEMLRDSGRLEEGLDFILGAWRPGWATNLNPLDQLALEDVYRVRLLKNRKGKQGEVVDLQFESESRRVVQINDPMDALREAIRDV